MIELIVNKSNDTKIIAAVENGKLVEIYEENEQSQKARNEGNIYIGIVKDIVPGMQAAFVDIGTEKNSFIHVKDVVPQVDEKIEKRIDKKIKDVVKSGEKILIQIQKDSNEKKGARTSTHIKLTGKYVILMPNTNIVTISQKIENDKERERLLEIVKNVLHFLQSENKNSAIYKYKVQTDCLNGQSLNDYKPSKFNGFAINIFYNQQGKVEAINFARDNYMVTIYNGKLNCVKGGKSIKSIEKK